MTSISGFVRTALSLVLLSGVAAGQTDSAGSSAESSNASSMLTERLAERLLGYWGDPAVSHAELLPGALPESLMGALPLPANAELLGSVGHYERNELVNVQVVLDADAPADEALAQFRTAFTEAGWVFAEIFQAGGFVPAQSTASGQACDASTGVFVYLHATSSPDGSSDVRVDANLGASRHNPPCDAAALTHPGIEGQSPLPMLRAPESEEFVPHGAMQMPEQASSTAMIASELELADLTAHYAGQLAASGWVETSTQSGDGYVYASWSFVDSEGATWSAVFTVATLPGTGDRHALGFFVATAGG